MTEDELQQRVDALRELHGDDEMAHSQEDEIWADVLRAIASGYGASPMRLAQIALTTREIKFCRWYA